MNLEMTQPKREWETPVLVSTSVKETLQGKGGYTDNVNSSGFGS